MIIEFRGGLHDCGLYSGSRTPQDLKTRYSTLYSEKAKLELP